MATDDAFFEELASINTAMSEAGARLDEVGANDGGVLVISRDDTQTMEAIAKIQDAQKRLAALLKTVSN